MLYVLFGLTLHTKRFWPTLHGEVGRSMKHFAGLSSLLLVVVSFSTSSEVCAFDLRREASLDASRRSSRLQREAVHGTFESNGLRDFVFSSRRLAIRHHGGRCGSKSMPFMTLLFGKICYKCGRLEFLNREQCATKVMPLKHIPSKAALKSWETKTVRQGIFRGGWGELFCLRRVTRGVELAG